MNESPKREQAIFEIAAKLPFEQRTGYLQAVCGSDAGMRERIQARLEEFRKINATTKAGSPSPFSNKEHGALQAQLGANGEPDKLGAHTPPGFAPETEDLPRMFGQFKLLEVIHQSNMSKVYKAEETTHGTIALKIPLLWKQDAKRRFEVEKKITVEAFGASIVPVYESGEIGGVPFYTMPFIQGRSLLAHIQAGRLELAQRLDLFEKLCELVEKLHTRKLVHLDLKPNNVMVDGNGDVWLLDFGISRSLENGHAGAQDGAVGGTPAYMAPEQTDPNAPKTPSADVYALGVMLYQLLTGELPYLLPGNNSEQMVRAIREFRPQAPSGRKRDLPDRYDALVLACLHKDSRFRPQSAGQLASLLQQTRAGARPTLPSDRKINVWLWSGVAVMALSAAFAAGSVFFKKTTPNDWIKIVSDKKMAPTTNVLTLVATAFPVKLTPNNGSRDYFEGEPLRLRAETDRDCFLAAFLHSRDGKTYLFFPDTTSTTNPVPAHFQPIESKVTVGEPYGLEVVHVIACTSSADFRELLANFHQGMGLNEFSKLLMQSQGTDETRGLNWGGAPDPAKWSSAYLAINCSKATDSRVRRP